MKIKVLYCIDDTTTELTIEGKRVTGQIFPDGRGMVQAFDEYNNLVRRVILGKVYLMDMDMDMSASE